MRNEFQKPTHEKKQTATLKKEQHNKTETKPSKKEKYMPSLVEFRSKIHIKGKPLSHIVNEGRR